MKFPKIEITNFLAITEATINMADRGLVAIQGLNSSDSSANSNGAGKSSIADALCWALFGTTARGATGDDVINNTVGKGCRVAVDVVDAGITYTITRHRKHKTGKNGLKVTQHDGLTETDLTKGTDKLTQEVVGQIIGSSLDVFAGSIYAGQEKMPDLPAMTDKTLKMLVEEAAGVTLLEEAYKKAREAAQLADTQLTHAASHADQLQEQRETLSRMIAGNKINSDAWVTDRDVRLANAATQVKGIVTRVKTVDLEVKAFDPAAIVNAIQAIDAKIAGVSAENDLLASYEREVSNAQIRLNAASSSLRSEEHSVTQAKHELAHVDAKVGTPCGECGRPITEAELSASRDVIAEKIRVREQLVSTYTKDKTDAEIDLSNATRKRDQFKAGMTDITTEQVERKRLEDQHAEYRQRVSAREVLMTEARGLKEKIESIKAETNPFTAQAEQIKADLEKNQKDLAEAKARAATAETTAAVEKEVVRVFSPAGVRARILDEVTPFLNAQTSKYLATLSDGNIDATWSTLVPAAKKGEFKEKFSIEVANTTGGGSFKTLSGGEKRKVRIATALALQDLVSTRASKPIDLFIGDEIDDALDASGLERLMLILDEKAKERGSVFVISHNELTDYIRQTLTIEKVAGGATKVTEVVA